MTPLTLEAPSHFEIIQVAITNKVLPRFSSRNIHSYLIVNVLEDNIVLNLKMMYCYKSIFKETHFLFRSLGIGVNRFDYLSSTSATLSFKE